MVDVMIKKISMIRRIFSESDSTVSIKTTVIQSICGLIVFFLPADKWYKASFKVYLFTQYAKKFKRKENAFQIKRAYILNQMLSLLTRTGVPFHIPYEFKSNNIKNENGILFCSTHMPLVKVAIKAMVENNYTIDSIIALRPTKKMKVSIWGMNDGVPALKADNNVLLKARTLLSKKAHIALMVDDSSTNNYSGNSMKLCPLTGSIAVFIFAILKKNGTISTWIEPAPFPNCTTDREIEENIAYLKHKTNQILEEYRNI